MNSEAPQIIEGRWVCEEAIEVSVDCLDRTYETRIADYYVTISTPLLPGNHTEETMLVSPEWVNHPPQAVATRWGWLSEWDGGTPQKAFVKQLRLAIAHSDSARTDEEVVDLICSAIDEWWRNACSWVQLKTQQELGRWAPQGTVTRSSVPMWSRRDDGEVREFQRRQSANTTVVLFDGINTVEFASCLKHAGNCKKPPTEWLLISDARSFLRIGDHRRAILDAGTAAEAAIGRMLETRLSNVDPVIQESLWKKYGALGGRVELMKGLEVSPSLPIGVQTELIEPRNKAAHAGATVSAPDATTAVGTATKIVEMALPLREQFHPLKQ